MKRVLTIIGLIIIAIIDIYLAKELLFPDKEGKKLIVIPEKKEKNPPPVHKKAEKKQTRQKPVKKEIPKKTEKNKETEKPKKTVHNQNTHKKEKTDEKEIDELINQIIEEAKKEYHYKEKKEEPVIKRLFRIGD
ncbi:hypothetical protein [Persephonella hydrogeniphila]|uniref:hypothetical protein n=1 Tax=Persephonella hydrogeniphila TaxID=198703 RepID=UPI000BE25ECC|nr:hypothetical protein [Persephonella hydrogeniphila]